MIKTIRADLVEQVSPAVHEWWLATMREQGISSRLSESGEELMVPYGELSEPAKDLDRGSVAAVLEALASTGHTVIKSRTSDEPPGVGPMTVDDVIDRLSDLSNAYGATTPIKVAVTTGAGSCRLLRLDKVRYIEPPGMGTGASGYRDANRAVLLETAPITHRIEPTS